MQLLIDAAARETTPEERVEALAHHIGTDSQIEEIKARFLARSTGEGFGALIAEVRAAHKEAWRDGQHYLAPTECNGKPSPGDGPTDPAERAELVRAIAAALDHEMGRRRPAELFLNDLGQELRGSK